jgi:OmpA-OmpF porin, OOP family
MTKLNNNTKRHTETKPSRRAHPALSVLTLTALAAALLVVACAGKGPQQSAPQPPTLSNASTQTDATIHADLQGYKAQQAAIKALNDSGKHPVKSYSLAKAQCWLDVSVHEYSRNDRSRFPQLALQESQKITDYLKTAATAAELSNPANPANKTPLVNDAAKLRDDLWGQATGMKGDAGFACAQQHVACAEVELVHAGNEHNQQGWRHAKPYVQIAEDNLAQAQAASQACGKAPEPAPAPPAPATPAAPLVTPQTIEKVVLNASALFKFNQRKAQDLLPQGRAELNGLAQKIKQVYASVQEIKLTGYTDRLGGEGYNNKLSLDRANTVKAYLQAQGVTAPMSTAGRGKADPVTQCAGGNTPNAKLTQCLQPNRRVEITIQGVKR